MIKYDLKYIHINCFLATILLISSSWAIEWEEKYLQAKITHSSFNNFFEYVGKNNSNELLSIDSIYSVNDTKYIFKYNPEIKPQAKFKIKISTDLLHSNDSLSDKFYIKFSKNMIDTLYLSVKILKPVGCEPSVFKLNKVFNNDSVKINGILSLSREVDPEKLKCKGGKHIKWVRIVKGEKNTAILEAMIGPDTTNAPFTDTIVVATGLPAWPYILVPTLGEAVSFISPDPELLDFGVFTNNKNIQEAVTLKINRPGKFDITHVEAKPDFLLISLSRPANEDWKVFVSIYKGEYPRPFKGYISLFIDSLPTPELTIPVKGKIINE